MTEFHEMNEQEQDQLFREITELPEGKAWRTACQDAGVPGRILHDFRRTAVRNLERAGVPRSVAMKITGHKTESVYQRYAIVSDADLRDHGTPGGHVFGHVGPSGRCAARVTT
jgi:hypothetical protein